MAMGPKLRDELIRDLKENRSLSAEGRGRRYWESVIDTIEIFLDRHFTEAPLKP